MNPYAAWNDAVATAKPARRGYPLRWLASISVVLLFLFIGLIGPEISNYDPVATSTGDRLLPPGAARQDGSLVVLGTDQVGRDVLAQLIEGARVSMLVGVATVLLAGIIGLALGVISGYLGGVVDGAIMRVADVQLAFPSILLAILIAALLGPNLINVIITLSVTRWVVFARVARAITLSTKELDFVVATRTLGAGHWHIATRCIVPATLNAVGIVATVELGLVILAEASLSFLGLGTPASSPSWGLTIANGRDYLVNAWWISAMPGVALSVLVVSVGSLGDELRDRLDPRLRGLS